MKIQATMVVVLLLAASGLARLAGADEPRYDASTAVTIEGEVVELGTGGVAGLLGMDHNEKVTVRTDQESLPVILAPKSYLDTQNYKVEKGERVTVTGSRIMLDEKPTIIAQEVKYKNNVLHLRAKDGTPLWTAPVGVQTPGK
jgi:hypothetical protein